MKHPLRSIRAMVGDALPIELFGLRRDDDTGYVVDEFRGFDVFLRERRVRQPAVHLEHLCKNVYFPQYVPDTGDCILDFGVGFGYECAYIASLGRAVKYIGVEIQPSVFECVSLTMAKLGDTYRAFPLPLGDGGDIPIQPTRRAIDATTLAAGGIPVPSVTWPEMVRRLGIGKIDYLKMNIEGAETSALKAIELKNVSRAAVSCHDFLAERGLGDNFRTSDEVVDILKGAGFITFSNVKAEYDYERGWVYATRNPDDEFPGYRM